MKNRRATPFFSALLKFGIMSAMLVCLPMIGVVLAGMDFRRFLEFPPLTRYVPHAGFSWPVFAAIGLVDLVLFLLLGRALIHFIRNGGIKVKTKPAASFPWWGWIGVLSIVCGWVVAWTRFEWAAFIQHHTFVPLWIGYILFVNGLCFRRIGTCALTEFPLRFLLLFPASSIFWWFFEYLNRFVQNWVYLGVDHYNAAQYVMFASLSFSTVLPAVYGTYWYLVSFTDSDERPFRFRSLKLPEDPWLSLVILFISGIGLALVGVVPDFLFPLLWVSPLLIITSLQSLFREKHIFSEMMQGNWRKIVLGPVAALICGFFWEMWNINSLGKWEYAIPFVQRFCIFEMPVLGYAGYLPFGLECLVVCEFIYTVDPARHGD